MSLKFPLSISLLLAGFAILILSAVDTIIYANLIVEIWVSWGFVGIGLTLMGTELLIASRLEETP